MEESESKEAEIELPAAYIIDEVELDTDSQTGEMSAVV
jgi:hypothetical protein